MARYWVRVYYEVLADPTLGRLPDHLWRRAMELLLLSESDGSLPGIDALAWELRTTPKEMADDLNALIPSGIVAASGSAWRITYEPRAIAHIRNQEARQSTEAALWRRAVFERDDYACLQCGKRDVPLQAHHIKPWATHRDDRFCIENGLTLCAPCHRKMHPRGWRKRWQNDPERE